jgi:hypothetical protein
MDDARHSSFNDGVAEHVLTLLAAAPPAQELEQGVIEEAQRRQRHRRALIGIVALGATMLAIGIHLGSSGDHHSARPAKRPASNATSSAATMFSQAPGMGVACSVPNSIACDRVALGVRLRRPAVAVSASVAGSPLKLNDPAWSGPEHNGRRSMFVGFLQPAGLLNGALRVRPDSGRYHWIGGHPVSALVRIVVDYGNGQVESVTERVGLLPGFG